MLATISGQVFIDLNGDGLLSSVAGETPLASVPVFLDLDADGKLDRNGFSIEPDDFAEDAVLNRVSQSIFLNATGVDNEPILRVTANTNANATTGARVFGVEGSDAWTNARRLRVDFTIPAGSVSVDVLAAAPSILAVGKLDVFNRDGDLLASVATSPLAIGFSQTLSLARAESDIAYAVAYVPESNAGSVSFDNLRVDDSGSEPWTLSRTGGRYQFENLDPGTYRVTQTVPNGFQQVFPGGSAHEFLVGQSANSINFGNQTSTISGFVFHDHGTIGKYEPAGADVPIHGATVFLDRNANGVLDGKPLSIEPDLFVEDEVLEHVSREITLSVVGGSGSRVTASSDSLVPNGRVFANDEVASWNNQRQLRADFASPVSGVQIDFIGGSETLSERGILEAYSADGRLLAVQVSDFVSMGQRQTMAIQRAIPEIAYVLAYTLDPLGGSGRLDSLRAEGVAEPTATTDVSGEYSFTPLVAGDYQVGLVVSANNEISLPSENSYAVSLVAGETVDWSNFGIVTLDQPPTVNSDHATTNEDTATTVDVLANDSDDGTLNPSSVTIVTAPAHGIAAVNPDGQIQYEPAADFFGSDSIQYTVEDDNGITSMPATVTIEVAAVNDRPVAEDDVVSVLLDERIVVDVLANDTDVDGSLVSESLTTTQSPTHGTVEVDSIHGTIIYTPNSGYVGADMFRYTISDEAGLTSNEALVSISVAMDTLAPVANADEATTPEGTATTIHVLWNDTDADGFVDTETVTITVAPDHGVAVVDPVSGDIRYSPDLGYVGTDTFQYAVRDNDDLLSNQASVTVTVEERTAPWQNPRNALDIDGDESVVPLDALLVINELNSPQFSVPGSGELPTRPVPPSPAPVYLDVDGDNYVSPRDAILVINSLNKAAPSGAEPAEGEARERGRQSIALGADAFADGEGPRDSTRQPISSQPDVFEAAAAGPRLVVVDVAIAHTERRDGASRLSEATNASQLEVDEELVQLLADGWH